MSQTFPDTTTLINSIGEVGADETVRDSAMWLLGWVRSDPDVVTERLVRLIRRALPNEADEMLVGQ